MIKKISIIIGFSCLGLFGAGFCLAEAEIEALDPEDCSSDCDCAPTDCESPPAGISPINGVFKWTSIGADKYMIQIDRFTQAEDNIYPEYLVSGSCGEGNSVCEMDCSASGAICNFYFVDLTSGSINYSTEDYIEKYCWSVLAYSSSGILLGFSEEQCFVSEVVPPETPPPPDDGNGDNGNGDDGNGDNSSSPIPLLNPLNCDTLDAEVAIKTCIVDRLINLLFFLVMALAPILIITSAILMATSAGNPVQLALSQSLILWTIIGIAVVLFAKGIPSVIPKILGG